jgi:hypothetical protein
MLGLARNFIKTLTPAPLKDAYRRRARRQFESNLAPTSRELIDADAQSASPAGSDPGADVAIDLALNWLCRAQDQSKSCDGGVARHFSLVDGWSASYPETTGYIVPTFLDEAAVRGDDSLRSRARLMLDWLLSIQLPEGGFQGGLVDSLPRVPVTFNTGQVLIGLARGAVEFGDSKCLGAMHRAARWLCETQDADGAWRRFATPFAKAGEKTYETHVAWGLFEAERAAPGYGYADAGHRQVSWALRRQAANGWFEDCCLDDAERPLTHTLGYALRGILEAYRMSGERRLLERAEVTAKALLAQLHSDGRLAGRFDSSWNSCVDWTCLTGSVQIAHSWLILASHTDNEQYLDGARRANAFVRRTLVRDGHPDHIGGIRGSWPVSGGYGQYQFLNWAAKFFIDSNRAEISLAR